jgi:hypothetical protein
MPQCDGCGKIRKHLYDTAYTQKEIGEIKNLCKECFDEEEKRKIE